MRKIGSSVKDLEQSEGTCNVPFYTDKTLTIGGPSTGEVGCKYPGKTGRLNTSKLVFAVRMTLMWLRRITIPPIRPSYNCISFLSSRMTASQKVWNFCNFLEFNCLFFSKYILLFSLYSIERDITWVGEGINTENVRHIY